MYAFSMYYVFIADIKTCKIYRNIIYFYAYNYIYFINYKLYIFYIIIFFLLEKRKIIYMYMRKCRKVDYFVQETESFSRYHFPAENNG